MDSIRGDMMSRSLWSAHKLDPEAYLRDCKRNNVYYRHNYLRHLPSDKNVPILEIGFGLGKFLSFCKSQGYTNVIGIDLSLANVEFCKALGHNVLHADAMEYLSANTISFGAVVMTDVIEHIQKDKIIPLLQAIHQNLSPGGVYIAKTINLANPILGAHGRYIDFTHEVGWTEESMSVVLEQAGFTSVQVLPSNLYVYYLNPLNYIALTVAKAFEIFFLLYYRLHGRNTTHIFSKHLLGIGRRP